MQCWQQCPLSDKMRNYIGMHRTGGREELNEKKEINRRQQRREGLKGGRETLLRLS